MTAKDSTPTMHTRDRLIAAAQARFYNAGFHAVGLDQVLHDVGITKQAFYRHFESKDELALETIRRRDALESAEFGSRVNALGDTAREKLLAMFDVLDEWFHDPNYKGCLFMVACAEFPNRHDPLHQAAADHFDASEAAIEELARRAGADDPSALAKEFVMLLQGALIYRLVTGDNDAAKRARVQGERVLRDRLKPSR